MEQLKIKKEFWDKIVSGEKRWEFRKLTKGLGSGIYEFESVYYECSCGTNNINHLGFGIDKTTGKKVCRYCGKSNFWPLETFGTAKLRAASLCNPMNNKMSFWYEEGADDNRIDKDTYDFVKENYISKGIDFIAYEISEVLDATN